MSIYSRITEYTNMTHGEFMFCHCGEQNAICPDCGAEVCVFCEDACPGCGESVF